MRKTTATMKQKTSFKYRAKMLYLQPHPQQSGDWQAPNLYAGNRQGYLHLDSSFPNITTVEQRIKTGFTFIMERK